MTFDTVPGWGLRPDGNSALGPTHGGVVIDKAGNIYVSANKGVVVFSPDGKVIKEYLGDKYSNIHDMKIREEGGRRVHLRRPQHQRRGDQVQRPHRRDRAQAAVSRGIGART